MGSGGGHFCWLLTVKVPAKNIPCTHSSTVVHYSALHAILPQLHCGSPLHDWLHQSVALTCVPSCHCHMALRAILPLVAPQYSLVCCPVLLLKPHMPSYHWLHFSAALCTIQCHSPALGAILALFVPQRSIVNHPITGCTAMQSYMPLLPGPQHSLAHHPAPPLSVCRPAILPLVVTECSLAFHPTACYNM